MGAKYGSIKKRPVWDPGVKAGPPVADRISSYPIEYATRAEINLSVRSLLTLIISRYWSQDKETIKKYKVCFDPGGRHGLGEIGPRVPWPGLAEILYNAALVTCAKTNPSDNMSPKKPSSSATDPIISMPKASRPRKAPRIGTSEEDEEMVVDTPDSLSFLGAESRAAGLPERPHLSFVGAASKAGMVPTENLNVQSHASIRGADARPEAEKKTFENLLSEMPEPSSVSTVAQASMQGNGSTNQEEIRSVGLLITGLSSTDTTAVQAMERIIQRIHITLPFELRIIQGTDVKGAADDYVYLRGAGFKELELLSTLIREKCPTGVEVHWMPMHGEDRSRQISVEMKGTGEKGVEKLLKTLQKEKIEVVKHTYNKNSRWCYIVLKTRAMMERVSATGNSLQIDATTLTPLPSRVIVPESPFEIIVSDCNEYQFPDSLIQDHCAQFGTVYGIRRDGDNCLIKYRDYASVTRTISGWSLEDVHAGLKTGSPRLVYDHNVRNANIRLQSAGVSQRDIDNSSAKITSQMVELRQELVESRLAMQQVVNGLQNKQQEFMEAMYKLAINQANASRKSAMIQDEIQREERKIDFQKLLLLMGKIDESKAMSEITAAEAKVTSLVRERSECHQRLDTLIENQVNPSLTLEDTANRMNEEMVRNPATYGDLSLQILVKAYATMCLLVLSLISSFSKALKSPLFRVLIAVTIISLVAASSHHHTNSATFHSFKAVTWNVNGLSWVPKALSFQDALAGENPEAFILTETGSADSVNIVPWPNHRLFRTDGKPWRGSRRSVNLKKWGVVIGIRNDIHVVESAVNIQGFRGRLAKVTILLRGVPWEVWGIYAPHVKEREAVQEEDEDPVKFWYSLSAYLESHRSTNQRLFMGDFNVSLSANERSGIFELTLRHTREAYLHFLNSTQSFDLWQTKVDRNWKEDRTWYRGDEQGTIIDRAALPISRRYLRNEIRTTSYFLPNSDHKLVSCVIQDAGQEKGNPTDLTVCAHNRRVTDPRRVSAERKRDFSYLVEELWKDEVHALGLELPVLINSRETFDQVYDSLCLTLNDTAKEVFQKRRRPKQKARHASSAALRDLSRNVKTCGSMIRSLKDNRPFNLSPALRVADVLDLFRCATAETSLLEFCKKQRTIWARERGKLQIKVDVDRAGFIEEAKMMSMINTGSIRRYVQLDDTPMNPPVLRAGAEYVTEAAKVRLAHKEYVEKLYAHEQVIANDGDKPWMHSNTSGEIRSRTAQKPSQWPQPVSTQDVEGLCKRGNPRPTPGPDGMEKWCLKICPASIKSVVAQLMTFAIRENYFPAKLKAVYVQMLFKKKDPLDLNNYRTIMYSNVIANLIGTFFTIRLQRYAEEMDLLPQSQLATKQKVEMGDACSMICLANCARIRDSKPLYILNKDVAKGFDNQRPQAFYDALQFFGLPDSIRHFDSARQEDYSATILTAYGHAPTVKLSGVTKQGDPPSPIKFCLSQAVGNHWIRESIATRNATGGLYKVSTLTVTTRLRGVNQYHTRADDMECEVIDVVMMDDIAFLSTDPESLKFINQVHENFQWVGGATTSWAKSRLFVDERYTRCGPTRGLYFDSVSLVHGRPCASIVSLDAEPLSEQSFTGARLVTKGHKEDIIRMIEDFQFPYTKRYLPVQGVKKIIETCLVSRIRAKLHLQAVSKADAAEIEMALIKRICEYLGWRRCQGKFHLLMKEYRDGGMGWTSIVRLNEDAAIRRTLRDLRMPASRLPVLHQLARITLSDLLCTALKCSTTLTSVPASKHWPTSWTVACDALNTRGCYLRLNDMDSSNCSWAHVLRGRDRYIPKTKRELRHQDRFYRNLHLNSGPADFSGPLIEIFIRMNMRLIQTLRVTMMSIRKHSRDSRVAEFWSGVSKTAQWQCLLTFHPSLAKELAKAIGRGTDTSYKELVSRRTLRSRAEREVASWDVACPMAGHKEQGHLIATDGSKKQVKYGISVTSAVVIAGRRLLAKVVHGEPDSSHGEIFAVIMALLAIKSNPERQPQYRLLTDYRHIVDRVRQSREGWIIEEGILKGELYWKWLLELVHELDGMKIRIRFEHIKAHTQASDDESMLNQEADRIAKAAHEMPVPLAPSPNFMGDVMILDAGTGHALDRDGYRSMDGSRLTNLYEDTTMTRNRTTRGFTTKVLHEIKMGIYETRSRRFDIFRHAMVEHDTTHGLSPLCDCGAYEDTHHVFVSCPLYEDLKEDTIAAITEIVDSSRDMSKAVKKDMKAYITGLFRDSKIWPGGRSKYYLGRLPVIKVLEGNRNKKWIAKAIVSRCDNLVGRIAGMRRKVRAETGEENRLAPRINDEWEDLGMASRDG